MKNKQIIFNVELARPTKVKQGIPPTVFTNDTNIVEFIFNVTDLEVPETATAEVNIFMRDGSFFQKDALVEGSEIRYTLSDTEGKHAGLAQIQMTLSYENKRYSTNIFQFKIDSGLNDKVAVEVLIQDWDTITTEARQYLEQMADYGTEFSEIIADAQTQVNANVVEGAVENKFNALEAEYAQDITSLKQSDISLTAQLQQTEQSLNAQLAQIVNSQIGDFEYLGLNLPSEFPKEKIPFELIRDVNGNIQHNFNIDSVITGAEIFVSTIGNDSNDGLSEETPVLTITKAIEIGESLPNDNVIISLTSHKYNRNLYVTGERTLTKNYTIKAKNAENEAVIGSFDVVGTWTTEGNAYKKNRSAVNDILDANNRDKHGSPIYYKKVNSVAEVQNEKGTWYTDGTTVWVRRLNDEAPDSNLLVLLETSAPVFTIYGKRLVLKDIIWVNSFTGFNRNSVRVVGDRGTDLYCENVQFLAGANNGLSTNYVGRTFLFNCIAAFNRTDGFNYHAGQSPNRYLAFEYKCISHHNGLNATGMKGVNNATTAHDGIAILRIGCIGYECDGPILADVNGCISVNYDCIMYNSLRTKYDTKAGFYFDNASADSPGKAYLIDCQGGGVDTYSIGSDKDIAIYVRNFKGKNILSGQKINPY